MKKRRNNVIPQRQKVNITEDMVKDAKPIPCPSCGCTVWRQDDQHHAVKRISGLMLGQSQDVYVFPPVRHCARCFEPIPDKPNDGG